MEITENYIKEITFNEYEKLALKFDNIAHPLKEVVIKHFTYFGKASPRGKIFINKGFVGTKDHEDLIDTIRHEIAHLIAGCRHKHDSVWKEVAKKCNVSNICASSPMSEELINNVYRYKLFAIFKNESGVFVGKTNSIKKEHIEYDKSHFLNGRQIIGYIYTFNEKNIHLRNKGIYKTSKNFSLKELEEQVFLD